MFPLKPPVQKKSVKNAKLINLPIFNENGTILDGNKWPSFRAIFNGKHVIVEDVNDISCLSNFGSFGEFGVFDKKTLVDYKTLQNQLLKHKNNWQSMELVPFEFPHNNEDNIEKTESLKNKFSTTISKQDMDKCELTRLLKRKFNLLQDSSDSVPRQSSNNDLKDVPNNWKDLKKNLNKDYCDILVLSGENSVAHYYLLLEEAFFLYYTLECLKIHDENGSVISVPECWKQFNGLKENFPFLYAAYHYYRSKGWIVKLGNQYGGNYVLYKASPEFYHSSYVVIININGQNSELMSSWPSFLGCNRVIESVNKDFLVCNVNGPPYTDGMHIDLNMYTVLDTIIRRWVPEQNRLKPTS